MSKLLVANWKCNPDSPGRAVRLARETEKAALASKGVEVVVAPPFPFLLSVGKVLRRAKLGAQDVFWGDVGASTGEVSWHQLTHLRVSHVIVGHSERRRWLRETDEMVNKKVKAALAADMKVILCVGEPWEVRRRGLGAAERFVTNQLRKDLHGLPHSRLHLLPARLLVAYEPIWAISPGRPDKPNDTVKMVGRVRTFLHAAFHMLSARVLYGGSVTSKNVGRFLREREIDGALVGGASLKASEFADIAKTASRRVG